ncbi:hypothetical protein BDQ17DRAFT_1325652 [Cyathus striatus]|nr:hypothetical protein BDQ17DRAFT_1325652 [Cyathus striatus]
MSRKVLGDSAFSEFLKLFKQWERAQKTPKAKNIIEILNESWEAFRKSLTIHKLGDATEDKCNTLWSWFYAIVQNKSSDESYLVHLYFEQLEITVGECRSTDGMHVHIPKTPSRRMYNDLSLDDFKSYNGKVALWLQSHIQFDEKGPFNYFKTHEEETLCNGKIFKYDVWICLTAEPPKEWHFPSTLMPLSSLEGEHGVIYDMVGCRLVKEMHDLTPDEALFAPSIKVPEDYLMSSVVYQLWGGTRAQQRYLTCTKQNIQQWFGIKINGKSILSTVASLSFQHQGFTLVNPENHVWASDKIKKATLEYDCRIEIPKVDSGESEVVSADEVKSNSGAKPLEDEDESTNEAIVPLKGEVEPLDNGEIESANEAIVPLEGNVELLQGDVETNEVMSGDGPEIDEEGSVAVQCNFCRAWMHIACQRDGHASNLKANMDFKCDECLYPTSLLQLTKFSYPQ